MRACDPIAVRGRPGHLAPPAAVGLEAGPSGPAPPPADLAQRFAALASRTRISVLDQLREPRFVADLADTFGMTRQGILKHLDALEQVGLVHKLQGRRGVLRAACYVADPYALFSLKEQVWDIASAAPAAPLPQYPTEREPRRAAPPPVSAPGLLVVRGDTLGRRFLLEGRSEWVIGRKDSCDITVPNDPYVSGRHCVVRHVDHEWSIEDLGSTNGTCINFGSVAPGTPHGLEVGHVVQVGRTHLVFQG